MFSPMTWIISVNADSTVSPSENSAALRDSTSAGLALATTAATFLAKPVNLGLVPTKSVSQVTSASAAVLPSSET